MLSKLFKDYKEIEKECENKLFIVIIRHTEHKKGEQNG